MVTSIPCFNYFFLNFRKAFFDAMSSHNYMLRFSIAECDALDEYVKVMAPIAVNLDILQGDRQSYLGSLLPHIVHLKDELTNIRDGISSPPLVYTKELLEVLLTRLVASDRFGPPWRTSTTRWQPASIRLTSSTGYSSGIPKSMTEFVTT